MNAINQIPLLQDRRILLGVTGSIAAYKAADLASTLTQAGALVDVILSQAALEFVSPLTFQSVTGRSVYTDSDLWSSDAHVLHIGLAETAEVYVIAPVTANTLAKLANGIADSLLTIAALAVRGPLLLAPAMDGYMYEHPATKANVQRLKDRGVMIVEPGVGRMASGQIGRGRLPETRELVGRIRLALGRGGPLSGHRVVVTAGGTQEPIDSVRVVSNRSSGKQGYALAQAALDRGAEVTLISGPTYLDTPVGADRCDVRTAAEMRDAVLENCDRADVLLMAAAVADFRPMNPQAEKLKRRKGVPQIKLEETDDILDRVARRQDQKGWPRLVVGFAAESEDLVANARAKLAEKNLTLIVANDITAQNAGFDVDTNQVIMIDAEGGVQELPLMSKVEVAEMILQRVIQLLEVVDYKIET
jgi:phosphopantothenoylcysteine decarboxylase/phosphopantothenate--cysteine ligase